MMRRYGQVWDYWEDHLTIPMLMALQDDIARHPSSDDLLAAVYKYKPPLRVIQNSAPPPPKPLMGQPEYEP